VARSLLLMPAGPHPPVESLALHGAESRPRTHGYHAGGLSMVKCGSSLRHCSARFGTGYRRVATAVEFHHLEAISLPARSRSRCGTDTAMHTHRSSAEVVRWERRSLLKRWRKLSVAFSRRKKEDVGPRCQRTITSTYLALIRLSFDKRPVCPRFPPVSPVSPVSPGFPCPRFPFPVSPRFPPRPYRLPRAQIQPSSAVVRRDC
jgi:hypothetical protein